jgi:hypothetical protein
MNIDYLYIILFIISLYFLINTSYKYNHKWFYKNLIVYISTFIYIISIFFNINFINKYLLPFLLLINILILIYITYLHGFSLLNLLGIIFIPYLLYIFNYKDFEMKNGLLVKPNNKWIYLHVIILTIFYSLSDNIKIYSKIGLIIIIWYPLLFPLNEYFKHRIFTLFFFMCILYFFKQYLK